MLRTRIITATVPRTLHFSLALLQLLWALLLPATSLAASVTLDWDPSTDPDLAGYRVYYQANSSAMPFSGTGAAEGTAPIDGGNATTATVTGLDPNNSYFFAVTAYNSAGVESVYSNVVEIPESAPPVVSLGAVGGASGTVALTATASDNVGVVRVAFFADGVKLAECASAPYEASWDTSALAAGRYAVSARAYDAAGNEGGGAPVILDVAGDTVAPTVSLSAASAGQTVSGSVAISAAASDGVGVARLELYLDGVLVWAGNQASLDYGWNTAGETNGPHLLLARALDAAGNAGTSSLALSVLNDRTAPVAAIVSPVQNATVGGAVTVTVSATDDIAVTRVEFYLDGSLQAVAAEAPFAFRWDSALRPNGSHVVTARAYDAAGNVARSAPVTVRVLNDLAVPSVTSFVMPAVVNSVQVPITALSSSDDVAVTGYLVTESPEPPAASASGWSALPPRSFAFAGSGSRTAYAWVKDAAGNVSAARAAQVVVDTVAPAISSLTLSVGSAEVTMRVAATDNVAVARIEIYIDGELRLEGDSPLVYAWSPSSRRPQGVTVKVRDTAGNVRSQSFRVSKS